MLKSIITPLTVTTVVKQCTSSRTRTKQKKKIMWRTGMFVRARIHNKMKADWMSSTQMRANIRWLYSFLPR